MSRDEGEVEGLKSAFLELNDLVYNLNEINSGELRDRRLSLAITNIETGALWLHNYTSLLEHKDLYGKKP